MNDTAAVAQKASRERAGKERGKVGSKRDKRVVSETDRRNQKKL